ncbi:MAG: hypothetical protein ACYTAN_17665, partial [Planctomycetota bacterium]
TLEDETDIFEATLFPEAYRRYGRLLRSAGPFLLKGKVEDQHGAKTVTAAFLDYLFPERRYRFRAPARMGTGSEGEAEGACPQFCRDSFDPEATVPTLFTA